MIPNRMRFPKQKPPPIGKIAEVRMVCHSSQGLAPCASCAAFPVTGIIWLVFFPYT